MSRRTTPPTPPTSSTSPTHAVPAVLAVPGRSSGRSSRPRRRRATHLRDDRPCCRAVTALAFASLAEYAVWISVLAFAHGRGGLTEAGIVSACLLLPAALVSPLAAREMSAPGVRNPLATGHALQTTALALAGAVLALELEPLLFYLAASMVAIASSFSRPAHHAFLAARGAPTAAVVATGTVAGAARVLGPLVAAGLLAVADVTAVFHLATALAAIATVLTLRLPSLRDPSGVRSAVRSARSDATGSASDTNTSMRSTTRATQTRHATHATHASLMALVVVCVATVVLGTSTAMAAEVAFRITGTGASGAVALLVAAGAGVLIGSPLASLLVRRGDELLALATGAGLVCLGIATLGTPAGQPSAIASVVVATAGAQTITVAGWLLVHRNVRPAETPTVIGLLESQQFLGNALGGLTVGLVTDRIALWPVLVVAAAIMPVALLTMAVVRVRPLHRAVVRAA